MSFRPIMLASLASICLAGVAPLYAAPLEATSLYREKARDCRTVDLATWSHPTRKAMANARVEIRKVELCNGGVYPVFTVALPGDPMGGINDSYFNKLHARMIAANGHHAYAFVDLARGVIVTVDMTAKREAQINYDEFDTPQAK